MGACLGIGASSLEITPSRLFAVSPECFQATPRHPSGKKHARDNFAQQKSTSWTVHHVGQKSAIWVTNLIGKWRKKYVKWRKNGVNEEVATPEGVALNSDARCGMNVLKVIEGS